MTSAPAGSRFVEWSSDSVRPSERTEAWRAALAAGFCAWQIDRSVGPDFRAQLRHGQLGGLRVVHTRCDPCAGTRPRELVAREGELYFGVQLARTGTKHLEIDGQPVDVAAGDLFTWRSDQTVSFAVTEPMEKVSVVLPWSEMRERLPELGSFKSSVISGKRGIGAVLYAHVDNLARQLDELTDDDIGSVRRATVELLVATLGHLVDAPPKALAQRYHERLQGYVLEHLQDDTLSPATIAQANHMSVRYVHLLFARLDLSVSTWIRLQRLERCRDDLESFAHRHEGVAEIAYRWGFRDPMHFSRLFKRQYGVNPTRYRLAQAG